MNIVRTPENRKRLTKMWVAFVLSNAIALTVAIALAFTTDLLASLAVGILGLSIANDLTVPRLRRAIRDEPEPKPDSSAPTDYGYTITDHTS